MPYKWNYPQEWLLEKCASDTATIEYLTGVINTIVPTLDGDTIQDLFQSEIDEDGFFEDVP